MPNTAKKSGNQNITSLIKLFSKKETRKALSVLLIRDEADYERALALMEYIMLETEDTPDSPFNDLANILGSAIEDYENKVYPIAHASHASLLNFLMEQHHLTQADLAEEFGSQGNVSQVLNGKRELSKKQIEALSRRFKINPSVFFDIDQDVA